MEHLTVPFIAFSNWLAALSPISAQGFDERISVIEVEIPVQVLHKGEPVEGLLAADFKVLLAGAPVAVLTSSGARVLGGFTSDRDEAALGIDVVEALVGQRGRKLRQATELPRCRIFRTFLPSSSPRSTADLPSSSPRPSALRGSSPLKGGSPHAAANRFPALAATPIQRAGGRRRQQSITKFLNRKPCLANKCAERPLGDAPMIRNNEAIRFVSQAFEGAYCLRDRDTG